MKANSKDRTAFTLVSSISIVTLLKTEKGNIDSKSVKLTTSDPCSSISPPKKQRLSTSSSFTCLNPLEKWNVDWVTFVIVFSAFVLDQKTKCQIGAGVKNQQRFAQWEQPKTRWVWENQLDLPRAVNTTWPQHILGPEYEIIDMLLFQVCWIFTASLENTFVDILPIYQGPVLSFCPSTHKEHPSMKDAHRPELYEL